MSQSIDESSAQSPKMVVITALITAVATIGAAFLGVVPNLYHSKADDGQVEALQRQLEQLRKAHAGKPTNNTLDISGTVGVLPDGRPLTWAYVYLIPLQTTPQLTGNIKEDGKFIFKGVPDQPYLIIVKDSDSKRYGQGQLDMLQDKTRLGDWLVIDYKVNKSTVGEVAENTRQGEK